MATKKDNPELNAVVLFGGKQYLVKVGDKIVVEIGDHKVGDTVAVKEVLLVNEGDKTEVGAPYVSGATVDLKIEAEVKGPKIEIRKYRSKSRYRRTTGYRQTQNTAMVSAINYK